MLWFSVVYSNEIIMGKYKFAELYLLTNPSVADNREPHSGRQVSRTLSKMCLALSHCDDGVDPHTV